MAKILFTIRAVFSGTSRLYTVTGDSMLPTFRHGDRLLVSPMPESLGHGGRGAVVIVKDPSMNNFRRYLKRIVGLPGEDVRLTDGILLVDGVQLKEPYIGGLPPYLGVCERSWKLGADECFVMGDNRAHSTDSREFGPVPMELLIGEVHVRWWPPTRWRRLS